MKVMLDTLIVPDSPYKPTLKEVTLWFDYLNDLIFDGKLKKFRKVYRMDKSWDLWGECHGYDGQTRYCELVLCKEYPSKMLFIVTLAHEMVHSYTWQFKGKIDHGKTFLEWREKFAKVHLPLTKTIGEDWCIETI
jgi:hypothetical protein